MVVIIPVLIESGYLFLNLKTSSCPQSVDFFVYFTHSINCCLELEFNHTQFLVLYIQVCLDPLDLILNDFFVFPSHVNLLALILFNLWLLILKLLYSPLVLINCNLNEFSLLLSLHLVADFLSICLLDSFKKLLMLLIVVLKASLTKLE